MLLLNIMNSVSLAAVNLMECCYYCVGIAAFFNCPIHSVTAWRTLCSARMTDKEHVMNYYRLWKKHSCFSSMFLL